MNEYSTNREFSDRFIPQIKSIIAEFLIQTASPEEDMEHNTDLVVLKTEDNIRFACRIRRPGWMKCKHEFTIRYEKATRMPTEWHKILKGWGDYIFYGIANEKENIGAWGIGKLSVFRQYVKEYQYRHQQNPGITKEVPTDKTKLKVFQWREIGDGFIVASENIGTEMEDFWAELKGRHEGQKIETILPKKENTQARLPGF